MFSIIVVLFVAALCLFLAEAFVLGWVFAGLGFVAVASAVTLTFLQYGFMIGAITFGITAIIGIGGFGFWMKYFPETAMGKKLINTSTAGDNDSPPAMLLTPGQEGVASTDLRPSGTAQFGGQRVDVVSEATFISKEVKICITRIEGSRVVVRPLESFQT